MGAEASAFTSARAIGNLSVEARPPHTRAWNIVWGRAKFLRKAIRAAFSLDRYKCPLCQYEGMFIHAGMPPVMNSGCPSCGSGPRQRLLSLVQNKYTLLGR